MRGPLLTELRMYRHALPWSIRPKIGCPDRDELPCRLRGARHHCGVHGRRVGPGRQLPRRIVQYWNDPEPPAESQPSCAAGGTFRAGRHLLYDRKGARRWLSENAGVGPCAGLRAGSACGGGGGLSAALLPVPRGRNLCGCRRHAVGRPEGVVGDRAGLVVFFEEYGAICNNLICAPPGHPVLGRCSRVG